MKKELQERRIKIVLNKLEAHLKNVMNMSQEQITAIAQFTDDER